MIVASKLDPGLVAGTDFSMVEGPLSLQRLYTCVPRNHLPQLIHPGPGSAGKRADSAPQVQAAYTSLTRNAGLTGSPAGG